MSTRSLALGAAFSSILAFVTVAVGCAPAEDVVDGDSTTGEALSVPGSIRAIGFSQNVHDKKAIALTFDDGPDAHGVHDSILDTLKAEGMKATFFINTDNTVNVAGSTAAKNSIKRTIAEGHAIGNHSVHHDNFNTASIDVAKELEGVRDLMQQIVPDAAPMSLYRCPYGNPFFGPQSRINELAPILSKQGVHTGWNIDTNDWKCAAPGGGGAQCVLDNLKQDLDAGHHGIVLMHSIHATTAQALPDAIRMIKNAGYHFVGIEDIVQEQFGATSAELMAEAPPAADGCTANGVNGTCMPTADCRANPGHVSVAGACPGAADIQCCVSQ